MLERDRELTVLSRLAADAANGSRAAVVTGAAGIGKTRLCDEFWETLPDGWVRLDVVGYQGDAEPPFRGLVELDRDGDSIGAIGDALATALEQRRGDGHLLVVVEDVQWMDPRTAPALVDTLRRLRDSPVLVLVTFRTGAHVPGSRVSQAMAALVRDRATTEIRLAALSPEAVGALAVALGGDNIPAIESSLYERTGGVPFFVEEVVRIRGDDVPWTVTETLVSQLRDLDADARALLSSLAVAARPVERTLLQSMHTALDRSATTLEAAGLVDTSRKEMRLRHALVAEAVDRTLADDERRDAHARLAGALAAAAPDARDRIARHWLEAGEHELAARQLVTELAPDAVPSDDDARGPGTGAKYELLALAAARAGDVAHALSLAESAERAYRSEGDERRADAMWARAALQPAIAFREASAGAGSFNDLAARSHDALVAGNTEEARLLAHEMRRQIGPHTSADPRRRCAVALLEAGDVDAAEVVLAGCERYAREHDLADELAMVGSRRAWLAFGRGHAGEALAHLRAAAVEAHRSPDGVFRFYFDPIHAFVLAACGEVEEARAFAEELLARENIGIFGAFPMALVDYEAGDVKGAGERLATIMPFVEALAADDVSSDFTSVLALQAMLELGVGNHAEALSIAGRCLAADQSAVSASRSDLLLTIAQAALALGDRPRAADAVASLGDHARWATGPGAQAAAAFGEALLDRAADRPADACDRFERAARGFELAPRWANAADAWCDGAEAAVRADRDPSPALHAARRICNAKGLGRVGERVAALEVQFAAAASKPGSPLEVLSPRERELVELIAEGLSNRDIAQRMYLSEGTVRNYVSRVFEKLGVARRTEIVRLVTTADQ